MATRVTIDIADDLAARVEAFAHKRGCSKSLIHREALNSYFELLGRNGLLPHEEPAPTSAPTAQGPRSVSARATPWRNSAVMPRVIPGGRREP